MGEPENSRFGEYATFVTVWMMMSIVGYQFTYLNPALPAIRVVFNKTYTERFGVPMSDQTWLALLTVTTTVVIIGAFVGTVISKPLVGSMSRKRLMQLCHVTHIIGLVIAALIGGLTDSYEAVIVGRFIIGLPSGVVFNIASVMVAEMSALNKQKFWQSIPTCALNFGIICGVTLGHPKLFGTTELWPVAASASVVPSIIYLISSIFIPNTPIYLVRIGKRDDAFKALTVLRKGPVSVNKEELSEIINKVKSENLVSVREIICSSKYRRMLLLVIALYANFMLCGVNNIGLYFDIIFTLAGIPPQNVTYISIGVFVLSFTFSIVGLFVVGRVGFKRFLLLSNIAILFVMVLYTISRGLAYLAPTEMSYLKVASVALFLIFWAGGVGVAGFGLLGLITTASTRPSALGLGSMVFLFSSWLTGFVVPYLLDALKTYSLVPWFVCTILMTIYFYVYIPITDDKTEEQIQDQMQGKLIKYSAKSEDNDAL